MQFLTVAGIVLATLLNNAQSTESDSFTEFLKQVEVRDSKTKAIRGVRVVDASGNAESFNNAQVEVSGGFVTFAFSRSYKTGTESKTFRFPITQESSLEVNRLKNYHEMISLKAKADAAMNAYQVFVTSDFRIRVGDSVENADRRMAMRRKVAENQPQWAGRVFYVYEDGLVIDSVGGVVENVWREEQKKVVP